MTELDLYKFIQDKNVEYHWYRSEKDENERVPYLFVMFDDLKEFTKMLGHIFFEDGHEAILKLDYVCFDGDEICEYFGLETVKVLPDLEESGIQLNRQ